MVVKSYGLFGKRRRNFLFIYLKPDDFPLAVDILNNEKILKCSKKVKMSQYCQKAAGREEKSQFRKLQKDKELKRLRFSCL